MTVPVAPSGPGRTRVRLLVWLPLLVAAVALVLISPRLLAPPPTATDLRGLSPKDRLDAKFEQSKRESDIRTSLLGGLAGLGVLLGWQQLLQSRQQFAETLRHGQQQLEQVRQGQITERFTRAIDQLGDDKPEIVLGGIYALERIAQDAPNEYRATIADVLTAYCRTHAPWPPSRPGQYVVDAPLEQINSLQEHAPTVQAALTVLGRGDFADVVRIELTRTDLRRANLQWANLHNANLQGAHLQYAELEYARLEYANLKDSSLQHAHFWGANVQSADLEGAHLQHADISRAHLQHVNLEDSYLQHANLEHAKLYDANLQRADLQHVGLVDTDLQSAHLWRANLQHADLRRANLRYADLGEADLQDADLWRANLQHAVLEGANLRGADLWEADLRGASADRKAKWPDGFDLRSTGVHVIGKPSPAAGTVGEVIAARNTAAPVSPDRATHEQPSALEGPDAAES